MTFETKHTHIAKGVAILLMVWHHLFRYPERIATQHYIPIIPEDIFKLEFLVGMFGKICVSVFLLLMGYGMYQSLSKKNTGRIKYVKEKLIQFMVQYWICFLVFVPIGLIFFTQNERYVWDVKTFVMSLVGFDITYNGEWWFVSLYIKLLLLFPLYDWLVRKNIFVSLILILIGVALAEQEHIPIIGNAAFWQAPFMMGMIAARLDLVNRYLKWLKEKHLDSWWMHFIVLLAIAVIRVKAYTFYFDPFFTPLFIVHSVRLVNFLKMDKPFIFIGQLSLYIWLVHSFFCYYYWQDLVFWPRYSLLIFAWLMILSTGTAILLNGIYRWVESFMSVGNLKGA